MGTRIDKKRAKEISEAVEAALQAVAERFGVTVSVRGGKFTETSLDLPISFAVVAENGVAMTREARDFQHNAPLLGLEPTDLGKTFSHGGHVFTITGLAARSRSKPIVATRDDGRVYKWETRSVLLLLGRKSSAAGPVCAKPVGGGKVCVMARGHAGLCCPDESMSGSDA